MTCCNKKMVLIQGVPGHFLPIDQWYYKCLICGKELKYVIRTDNQNHMARGNSPLAGLR